MLYCHTLYCSVTVSNALHDEGNQGWLLDAHNLTNSKAFAAVYADLLSICAVNKVLLF